MKTMIEDNRAESPIEVIVTILLMLILMTGVWFAVGNFVDGFVFMMQKLPYTLQPIFQGMMGDVLWFATLFFALPSFMGAVLIVWGVKAILKKQQYTRAQDQYAYEEFN